MNTSLTKPSRATSAFLVGVLAFVLAGCGSMEQSHLGDHTAKPFTTIPEGQRIPVIVGNVTADIEGQPLEVRESVCRYLHDLTTAEIATHGAFVLVSTNTASDLLSGLGVSTTQNTQRAIIPSVAFDVDVTRLEEKLGATIKIGFVSSQKKHAVAEVKVTCRSLNGGADLISQKAGRSSKGAWGVITSVNREAMKGGREEWKMDGSMIGVACSDAVRLGIEDLEKQLLFHPRTLEAAIEKRLLRPRTGVGSIERE